MSVTILLAKFFYKILSLVTLNMFLHFTFFTIYEINVTILLMIVNTYFDNLKHLKYWLFILYVYYIGKMHCGVMILDVFTVDLIFVTIII